LTIFAALFDDVAFKLFGKRQRKKAFFLGCANLLAAITVEDLHGLYINQLLPLQDDPKGGPLMQFFDWTSMHLGALDAESSVVPCWYVIAIIIATSAYFFAFRRHNKLG
jgi:hypothetical protein